MSRGQELHIWKFMIGFTVNLYISQVLWFPTSTASSHSKHSQFALLVPPRALRLFRHRRNEFIFAECDDNEGVIPRVVLAFLYQVSGLVNCGKSIRRQGRKTQIGQLINGDIFNSRVTGMHHLVAVGYRTTAFEVVEVRYKKQH